MTQEHRKHKVNKARIRQDLSAKFEQVKANPRAVHDVTRPNELDRDRR